VPAAILKGCLSLVRLSLHGNPLTIEQLRSADGFQEFNARRCASADKQVWPHMEPKTHHRIFTLQVQSFSLWRNKCTSKSFGVDILATLA